MKTLIGLTLLLLALAEADAASIAGKDLPLRSSGAVAAVDASGWTLSENGFVGAYLTLAADGDVTIALRASGVNTPHVNVVVADAKAGFDVANEPRDYSHTFPLKAGTWLVRVELTSHSSKSDARLSIHSLDASGATLLKENTDALALTAANSYIEHYRKGNVVVSIPANVAAPGTPVQVKLRRHAFNFGGTIHGENNLQLLAPEAPPDSDAAKFQQFVNSHFNLLVASNGGKWLYNEKQQDAVTMQFVDACLAYAKAHGMRARQHALLWDNSPQEPAWVNALLDTALNDKDAAGSAAAKKDLRERIAKRIAYYAADRSANYVELDVLNEPYHQPRFWKVFGAEGLADIFREAEHAVESAGGRARLYLNEYNVFQWSSNVSMKDAPLDPYANWYRQLFESVRDAGGPVSGVGIQYYAIKGDPVADKGNPHSPARITEVLQNVSVLGLPISLTEWGVQRQATPEQAADILEDTMRLIFGTDQCTTFIVWGFWGGSMWDRAPQGALVDKQWKLTPVGERYEKLKREWTTDLSTTVGVDQMIRFDGFFGDYELKVRDKIYTLTLTRGKTDYALGAN